MRMPSDGPLFPRHWHKGDVLALGFLLLGLLMVLLLVATGLEHATWALWVAIPMIMFSLAYLSLVSLLTVFLGPRSKGDSQNEQPAEDDHE